MDKAFDIFDIRKSNKKIELFANKALTNRQKVKNEFTSNNIFLLN
jgi:hypothetical protein